MQKILVTLYILIAATSSFLIGNEECCQEYIQETCPEEKPMFHGHILSLGPEWYYINRTKKGGTTQHGSCIGVRANYDHIKRYKIYYGGQAFYGTGTLDGHTGSDLKLRSRLTEAQVEGSLGYTFQAKWCFQPWITPIIGYGYFYDKNDFKKPSPLTVTYTLQYSYVPFGFLSGLMLNPSTSLGLNVRVRYPIEPKCRISNDPEFDDTKMHVDEELGFRIELPLVYKTNQFCRSLLVGILPFFDFRHYGGRANYPFDFIDTKLRIYGANVQIMYQF
jgi:hypothetical protein